MFTVDISGSFPVLPEVMHRAGADKQIEYSGIGVVLAGEWPYWFDIYQQEWREVCRPWISEGPESLADTDRFVRARVTGSFKCYRNATEEDADAMRVVEVSNRGDIWGQAVLCRILPLQVDYKPFLCIDTGPGCSLSHRWRMCRVPVKPEEL